MPRSRRCRVARGVCASLLLASALTTAAVAQAPADPASLAAEEDDLARRATDPTASPMTFSLINDVSTSYYRAPDGSALDETGYSLRFQPVLPFTAWGVANIFRMTIPYQVDGPGPEGLADVTIFDLVVLPRSWGRLGLGVVGSFAAATRETDSHASFGPAIGFVAPASKSVNLGLFNQNLFGDGVAISQIQPIVAWVLGGGWSLSLGDLQWPYDWNRHEFVSMPIGVQLGKVQPIAGQAMRFSVNPQYDMKGLPGTSRFKVLVTIQLLVPDKG